MTHVVQTPVLAPTWERLRTGQQVEHIKYDSFGNIVEVTDGGGTPISGPSTRYTYTGREWDAAVDLYHLRARYYDPRTARFASEDPIGFAGGDYNLNRYVGNSPTNGTDPSGLAEWWNGFWDSIQRTSNSWTSTYEAFWYAIIGDDERYWEAAERATKDSLFAQVENADSCTKYGTYAALGVASAAAAAAGLVGGVELAFLGNQSLLEFNILSQGNVLKVISRPGRWGFRIDPAHHGKPWGHPHFWEW